MAKELKPLLGRWDSAAIIIAIVIGVGIFRVPAEVARYLHSPRVILLAWLTGGIIVFLGALCYCELSSSYPKTGGNYIYLKESYGPGMGFLFGWTELLVIHTGSVAAVSFIAAEHLLKLSNMSPGLVKPVAISIVIVVSLINILSLHHGKRAQEVLTIAKVVVVFGIIILGFTLGKGSISNFQEISAYRGNGLSMFALALIPILWVYGGWHENTFVAGETKDPVRTIPFALLAATLLITVLYLAINLVYIYLIPVSEISNTPLIGSEVLSRLFGLKGSRIFDFIIVVFSLGSINATMITGSRITYAMSKDHPVFSYIGNTSKRYSTPHRAIALTGLWSAVLIWWGSFNRLLFFTGILVWIFFALAVSGIFIARRRFPNMNRPYKVWGYPVVPILFVITCICLSANALIFYPVESAFGILILLSGIPVYLFSKKIKRNMS